MPRGTNAKASRGRTWLAGKVGVSRQRIAELVSEQRIPRKAAYDQADADKAKAMLLEGRAVNNATSGAMEEEGGAANMAAIEALTRNPEKIQRIKYLIAKTAAVNLEVALKSGGYLKKEEVEQGRVARTYSIRGKLQELALRSSLIANKSEAECADILTGWAKEICDYYANGGE